MICSLSVSSELPSFDVHTLPEGTIHHVPYGIMLQFPAYEQYLDHNQIDVNVNRGQPGQTPDTSRYCNYVTMVLVLLKDIPRV